MNHKKISPFQLTSVMFAFFVMGFVDLVGISTNYIKEDFHLTDKTANLFPSMVFFWFLILSVPTGIVMSKIKRRKTVLLGLAVTILAVLVPVVNYSYASMFFSFSLLGIGNTLLQVSINPLLTNIVNNDKLASSFTLGQFIKAIASFIAPIIASWSAMHFHNWRYLYPIFTLIGILSILLLGFNSIEEKEVETGSSFRSCFSLLGNKLILLSFVAIMCHVGIDVGTNLSAPKILMERLHIDLLSASYATSVYFLFRTIGCFTGTFILAKISSKKFFIISIVLLFIGVAGLYFCHSLYFLYACIGLIGYGNSNLFSIVLSNAMLTCPDKKNEVSGLMIMGLFGGTVFPFLMGILSDLIGSQIGSLIMLSIGVIYFVCMIFQFKKQN